MKVRMENPTAHLTGPVNAMKAIQQLVGHPHSAGVDAGVIHLTHLRVSQINGAVLRSQCGQAWPAVRDRRRTAICGCSLAGRPLFL